MSELLQRICDMDHLERDLFLDLVFENDKITDLAIILDQADENVRKAVLEKFPNPLVNMLRSKMQTTADIKIHSAEKEISVLCDDVLIVVKEINEHEKEHKKMIREARAVMKAGADADFHCVSDQRRGIEVPPIQKEYDSNTEICDLPQEFKSVIEKPHILDCITDRKSRRKYTGESVTLEELSYLLWATQGVRRALSDGKGSYRTVPSGGARQPFETYVAVQRVTDISSGMYRYLPFEHSLVYLFSDEKMSETLTNLTWGQSFVGTSAVCFIWSVIPYRSEWRYALEAKKDILQESGHICQNLYLACESIGCGTCAIGAYNQTGIDTYLRLDGEDEFVIYLAPVGRAVK
jgi:SagB-type dehydrogenase family enzyme